MVVTLTSFVLGISDRRKFSGGRLVSVTDRAQDHQVVENVRSPNCPWDDVINLKAFAQLIKAAVFASVTSLCQQPLSLVSTNKNICLIHAATAPVRIILSCPVPPSTYKRTELSDSLIRSLFRKLKLLTTRQAKVPVNILRTLRVPPPALADTLLNANKRSLSITSFHRSFRGITMSYYIPQVVKL